MSLPLSQNVSTDPAHQQVLITYPSLFLPRPSILLLAGPEEEAVCNPYMIPTNQSDLYQPTDSMHQALFLLEPSRKLIKEVRLY